MHTIRYAELIEQLFSVNVKKAMVLGLSRMQAALKALGNPEKAFRAIHVAGTNGKGSVSLKIAEALSHDGSLVGLYTSPHIGTFRERVLCQGVKITEEEVTRLLPKAMKAGPQCTFFELTTLMAFLYFKEKGVEWAVIETGIGGRLDATNVIVPALSIITSVSLDHTEWLGGTLEEISLEKAGIIKERVPVVLGPTVPGLVEDVARERNALCIRVQGKFSSYDEENRRVALEALTLLHLSESAVAAGLAKRPSCRLESVSLPGLSTPVVLDVAHNPGGFASLFNSLNSLFGKKKWRLVLGMGKDKDHHACLSATVAHVEEIYLVRATGSREGTATEYLEDILLFLGMDKNRIVQCDSVKSAVNLAASASTNDQIPLLIAGTFFIMADAKEALGLSIERDPVFLSDSKKPL
ncbi:bifunctional folylpolyglutamate synthase/dihydrofolate synthase [Estrella lausannensis]|uniref:Dihydrofolate synthase/folylpolyglutamate synthase n=1 Tax=Estrella lausannensis TaxID=483423 RepID=A0A0H5E4A2_9BACT|nr:Mur ligase family protein [Estrella lausannensis]CRX38050.1 Putative folylpolyglutamate synthase [Estrella lausannensis]